jgi:uncharacterized membrane-anchored protein
MGDKSAKKAIENHKKHEAIVDAAVKGGQQAGLNPEPTQGNSPKGDIRVPKGEAAQFEKEIRKNIKDNRNE